MQSIKFLLLVMMLGTTLKVVAQQFGGHPASQQWKQVSNDSVKVIFPSGLSANASRVLSLINNVDNGFSSSRIRRFRQVPIVLQHRTNISNGYVGMGPWRSEFFLTPDQNSFELGSIPWIEQLTLHEYRHVQQYRHFMQGLTGLAYRILGQEGGVLLSNAAIPNWFWEGDAVWQETRSTVQGRGRIPAFFNGYRSLWNAGKAYSWMKLRNGSLVDYVPDHYQLGYLLSSYGHDRYGKDFWNDVTADAARFRGFFYPFQKAILRKSGLTYGDFRNQAFTTYKEDAAPDSYAELASKQKHFQQNIDFPQWLNDSTVVAVRSSYSKVPEFVMIDPATGAEKVIATRYISLDRQFSLDKNTIVYAGWNTDTRWGFRDYHDIVSLDIKTGKQVFITKNKRYFSPDSKDGKIIAVHSNASGSNELHLLDAATGSLLKKIGTEKVFFHTYPKFFDESNIISAVRDSIGRMSIIKIDLQTNEIKELIPFTHQVIGFLSVENQRISFTGTADNAEQAYVWEDGKMFMIKEDATLGVYQPDEKNGKWVMKTFTATGDKMVISASSVPVERFRQNLNGPYPSVIDNANISNGHTLYDSSVYRQGKHLFNFHSIIPTVSDPDYAISIVSDNVLNNFISEINLQYNTNEQYKKAGVAFLYGGLYPWLRASLDYTMDRSFQTRNSLATWNELEARFGFQLPLNFTRGSSYRALNLRMDYVHNDGQFTGIWKDSTDIEAFGYINPNITFSNRIQQARQHIYPRLGYNVQLDYRRAVVNREGNRFYANAFVFLPGIHRNHNLVVQSAYQERSTNGVIFSNNFPMPRGYVSEYLPKMFRVGVNYHFPIVYPDWGFENLLYILRIRGNGFYDQALLKENGSQKDYSSAGMEIYFDTKWWNQQNLSFGFRVSYPFHQQFNNVRQPVWDFILPLNIFNR